MAEGPCLIYQNQFCCMEKYKAQSEWTLLLQWQASICTVGRVFKHYSAMCCIAPLINNRLGLRSL